MQRLERAVELVGAHLETPRVGGDRGDLSAVQPPGAGERQARGGTPGVSAPAVPAGPGQLAGPDQHDIAPADAGRLALRGDDRLQVIGGDRERVGQLAVAAERPAGVEQDRPADDQRGRRFDPGDPVSVAGHHVRRVPSVPGSAMVEDVTEPIPLRGALQRHEHHVVGAAEAVREALDAARRVRAGVQHGVHRVGAPPPPGLRAIHVERLRQGKRDAAADQPGALHALAVGQEVQRAPRIVGTPATPVGARGGRVCDRLLRPGRVHRAHGCGFIVIVCSHGRSSSS